MSIMNMLDSVAIAVLNSRAMMLLATGDEGTETTGNTFDASTGITGQMANDGTFGNVTNAISQGGNSLVYIVMMLVGFCGAVGFGVTALKLMVGGGVTKSNAKGEIGWILVGLAIGFGAISIVGLVQGVANGLFSGTAVSA